VVNGLDAVAACVDSGARNAAFHCRAEPVTRPNSLVGSAANRRPRPLIALATAMICVSVAPNWLAALSSELKWRYCDDPGAATLASASPSALVELGSDR
jgi:hypothetical protein